MVEERRFFFLRSEKIGFPTFCKIVLFVLILYLSPLLILGQDSHFRIHDSLIGKHDILKVLIDSGKTFSNHNSIIEAPLNGIPRDWIGFSQFSFNVWLAYLFGSFPALVIHKIILHFVAFFGMYHLLVRHFLGGDADMKVLSLGVALGFAVLPHWEYMGLGVAGQPLALGAFLTIRKGENHLVSWLILALIPFYSNLYYSFSWFLVFIALFWGYDLFFKRHFNGKFLGAIFFMSLVYLLINFELIYGVLFDSAIPSVRKDFIEIPSDHSLSLFGVYKVFSAALRQFGYAFKGLNPSLHTFFILPTAIIGAFILFEKKIKDSCILYVIVLIFICGLSPIVFRVLDSLPGFKTHIHINTPLLVPMLWFIVFALSLKLILMHNKRGMRFVCVIISLQVLLGFFFHGEIQKHRKPSYRELFSVDLFKQIDDHIGRPKSEYRIASIGIFPGISLYNGFYTLDGYHTNYPLEHKKKFRKIIAGELRKSTQAREHFDDWGGRCYVFVSELQFGNWTNTKNKNVVIQNLDLNTNVFVEMGGEYIISAVEIKNYKANQLDFEKVFEDVNSPWRLYLYRAKGIPSQSKMPEI